MRRSQPSRGFGTRDRCANIETNYLPQRIEQYQGLTILTTNNSRHFDRAFAHPSPTADPSLRAG